MKNKVLYIIIGVAASLGAILLLVSSLNTTKSSTVPSSSNTSNVSSSNTSSSTSTSTKADVTMKYTDSGFQPNSLTMKSGQTIAFENDSSRELQVDSDPHPVHTNNAELNVGSVPIGSTQTVTLTTKGTWGIHNHLDPSDTATVVVQ